MSSGRISKYSSNEQDVQPVWQTAVYLRLSREDGDKLESDSIVNQRKIIKNYLDKNSDLSVYDYYIDDGYSGTNFNRPNLQRLLEDIKSRKVNCLIVKDLSRFGRNYHETGRYLEVVFPLLRLRFISVNDAIDSFKNPNSIRNSTVSFKNVMNDEYSRDISNKIRSSFNAKRKRGEYIGSFALYGYIKDPNDRHKLIIDEEAAENVRYIYNLFLEGHSIYNIAFKLKELGIVPPLEYKRQKGMKVPSQYFDDEKICWPYQTLRRMLQNEMYIGNMVQATYQNISYKVRKSIRNSKDKYIIKEGTHEPIIDRDTFYKVQERFKRDGWQPKGSAIGVYSVETGSIYVGYIKCADCGRAMQRSGYIEGKNNFYYFICGSYLQWKQCSRHAFRINKLNEAVLSAIRKQVELAIDMDEFINTHKEEESNIATSHLEREINACAAEKTKVVKLQNDLYLDLKNDIISQDQYFHFRKLYAEKLSAIETRLEFLENELNRTSVNVTEVNTVLDIFKRYKNITKLSRDIIVELIDCIWVYKNNEIRIQFKYQDIFKKIAELIEESKLNISSRVEVVSASVNAVN